MFDAIPLRDGRQITPRDGDRMLMVGAETTADLLIEHPMMLLPDRGPNAARDFDVFTDGEPPLTLRNDYPRTGPDWKVLHDRTSTFALRGEVRRQ